MEKDTRTKLLEAATELFAAHGFDRVSVRQVTEAANVNVAAVSYHFKNKKGLYQAVLEEQFTPIRNLLQTVKNLDAPLEKLQFYAEQTHLLHKSRPLLARFMIQEFAIPTSCGETIIEEHIREVYAFLCLSVQEGKESGIFDSGLHVPYAAHSLAAILNFYFLTRPLNQKLIEINEPSTLYIKQAFQIYLHGILTRS